jgi:hypothetical protein
MGRRGRDRAQAKEEENMKGEIEIRTVCREDFPGVVALLSEADAVDHQDRVTTVEDLERDLTYPGYHPESDTLVACVDGR